MQHFNISINKTFNEDSKNNKSVLWFYKSIYNYVITCCNLLHVLQQL